MFINDVELKDAVFLNEYKPSRVNIESKYTEDGREFIFVKKQSTAKEPFQFVCDKVPKVKLEQLKSYRDNATICYCVLADAREITAMIVSVEDKPDVEYEEYLNDDEFTVILGLKELI